MPIKKNSESNEFNCRDCKDKEIEIERLKEINK